MSEDNKSIIPKFTTPTSHIYWEAVESAVRKVKENTELGEEGLVEELTSSLCNHVDQVVKETRGETFDHHTMSVQATVYLTDTRNGLGLQTEFFVSGQERSTRKPSLAVYQNVMYAGQGRASADTGAPRLSSQVDNGLWGLRCQEVALLYDSVYNSNLTASIALGIASYLTESSDPIWLRAPDNASTLSTAVESIADISSTLSTDVKSIALDLAEDIAEGIYEVRPELELGYCFATHVSSIQREALGGRQRWTIQFLTFRKGSEENTLPQELEENTLPLAMGHSFAVAMSSSE